MRTIEGRGILVAALATFVMFALLELVVEAAARTLFGVSENELLARTIEVTIGGLPYYVVMFALFFVECLGIAFVYVLIRDQFHSMIHAALVTSGVALLFLFLSLAVFTNKGALPLRVTLLSLAFNLIELPPAVVFGAVVYEIATEVGGRDRT
jgi:hypothetical protein